MNRAEKKDLIADFNEKLNKANALVIAHYSGLTVAEMTNLRSKIRAAGAGIKVSKNRLVKLAAKDTKFENVIDLLKGPTAIAYSEDPIAAAKAVAEFAKTNDKLVIIGGAFGDQKLDANGVKHLATMPSLDELRSMLIGMLKTPATRIASVLQAPGGQVARVIAAHATKEG